MKKSILNEEVKRIRQMMGLNENLEELSAKDQFKQDLQNDPDYKESPNVDSKNYFGNEYNVSFVKALNDTLKSQREERGEKIPTESAAKFNTDTEGNTKSPVLKSKEMKI